MKTYRKNAVMAGALYFMGTVFGVVGGLIGGEALTSLISSKPLAGLDLLDLAAASSRLTVGAFLFLMMGISLVTMTVFLYPIFRKDSEELAIGFVLFRGALEGATYISSVLGILMLATLGNIHTAAGTDSAALQSMANVVYRFLDFKSPVGTIIFLIGATCLYFSFYRTRLIPRWLSVWGLVGVVPYMAYALLHLFQMDNGIGFYLQMVLAPQELVMGAWLIIRGFNRQAVAALSAKAGRNEASGADARNTLAG